MGRSPTVDEARAEGPLRPRWLGGALAMSLLAGLMAASPAASEDPARLDPGYEARLVTPSSAAQSRTASGTSRHPSVSADGRFVAFSSDAEELATPEWGTSDVIVLDRSTGSLVPLLANSESSGAGQPSISGDGSHIAYLARPRSLPDAPVGVHVTDRVTHFGVLASVALDGGQADGASGSPDISADDRFVAFHSEATNLVAGDGNGYTDVFVRDRIERTTERVSVASTGIGTNGPSRAPAISGDGSMVAFESEASSIVDDDTNATTDIFVTDRTTGITRRIVAVDGSEPDGPSRQPAISDDGRFVAFSSEATNLVPGDTNGVADVFVADLLTGSLRLVSRAVDGAPADGASRDPSLSPDGRHLALVTAATNLVEADPGPGADLVMFDLASAARRSWGGQGDSHAPALGGTGTPVIAFTSAAPDLVAGDTNDRIDVFVDAGTLSAASATEVDLGPPSEEPAVSADASVVATSSGIDGLDEADDNGQPDIYVISDEGTVLASVNRWGGPANGPSYEPAISDDGERVAFTSRASNLVAGDRNRRADVFVRDLGSGTTRRIGPGSQPALSGDGRWLAYVDPDREVYLVELATDRRIRASAPAPGGQPGRNAGPHLDHTGRRVVFYSFNGLLPADDDEGNGPFGQALPDIYLFDRLDRELSLLTDPDEPWEARHPRISGDGRWVVFENSVLVGSVHLHDLISGETSQLPEPAAGGFYDDLAPDFRLPDISDEGDVVVFESWPEGVACGGCGYLPRAAYRWERASGLLTRLVTTDRASQGSDGRRRAVISGDGQTVLVASDLPGLVAADGSADVDLFALVPTETPPPVTVPPVTAPPTTPPVTNPTTTTPTVESEPAQRGYTMARTDGVLHAFGDAPAAGPVESEAEIRQIVASDDGSGYWVLDAQGQVHALGVEHHGDLSEADRGDWLAGETPASLSVLSDGSGYWIFTNRGRALAFGAAPELDDLVDAGVAEQLVGPIVDSVATPDGAGAYMVASDGGVFTLGSAAFLGSMGDTVLNQPVNGLVPDPDGVGYWLVAADGGIFAFDAPFRGSVPGDLPAGVALNAPVIGALAFGDGYLMVASDGGIFTYSSLPFLGSLGDTDLPSPVVGVAAFATE